MFEFGCLEIEGEDKAAWLRDAYSKMLTKYPAIKAVAYHDNDLDPNRNWAVDTSPESLAAFKIAIADNRYLPKIDTTVPTSLGEDLVIATFEPGWEKDGFAAVSDGNDTCSITIITDADVGAQAAMMEFSAHTDGWSSVRKWVASSYWANTNEITFWLKGDGSDYNATIELIENRGTGDDSVWYYSFLLSDIAWYKVSAPLSGFVKYSWSGGDDVLTREEIGHLQFRSNNSDSNSFKVDQIQQEK